LKRLGSSVTSVYKQTTDHTCADATLMCALYELFGEPMSTRRELELWNRGCPKVLQPILRAYDVGTPPGFLTRYVQNTQLGETCTLHMFRPNIAPPVTNPNALRKLCRLHDWFSRAFLGLKPPAAKYDRMQTTADVLGWLDSAPLVRVQQVAVLEGGGSHFLLIRRNDSGDIVVMDPLNGVNQVLDFQGLDDVYGKVLFGYAMVHVPKLDQVKPLMAGT